MSTFLYYFRYGEEGRKMVVRLLDGKGRLAWTAGYDGAGHAWGRARPELTGCGPIWYVEVRTQRPLPTGARSGDPLRCPLPPARTTVLR
jgi:hypothetical protein